MKQVSIVIISIVVFCTVGSLTCLRLDTFLFNGQSLSAYSLDGFRGEQECTDAIDSLMNMGIISPKTKEIKLLSGKETIYGILLFSDSVIQTTKPLILYFHGNKNHIDYYWQRCRLLCSLGYPVFVIDYRGFGKSSGQSSSESGLFQDGSVALQYIRDSLNVKEVIVYAYSLGSLIGCEVVSTDTTHLITRCILEAPIGSVATLVNDGTYLNMPASYVTDLKADNTEKIRTVSIPLLLIHGTCDETLKYETHGLPLWRSYSGKGGKLIVVENAGHSTIPQTIGYAKYRNDISSFVKQ